MKFFILIVALGAARATLYDQKLDAASTYDCPYCQPEQVHIAFGEKSNDIVVTWSTFNDTEGSFVQYGVGVMSRQAAGSSSLFRDGGKARREQYIHRVTLPDLQYNTTYVYHAGSEYGWSELFSFHVPPQGTQWPVRAAIYGDMGNKNAHSLSYLQDEAERGHFDLILHVGDFAYDMHDDDGKRGDQFMRQIQPLAAMVPYMTCPGNHEATYNFSNYRARFSMPGGTESMFYSFDLGPLHIVSISTEYYYFLQFGARMLFTQYAWLQQDLAEANKEENRKVRPWIVLMGHRPMYCSNSDDIDCSFDAPVHVVTGSAGCQEEHSNFNVTRPAWSAFRTEAYGYTRLLAHNTTHLYIEQVDVEQQGKVVDSFWLIKDHHGEYHY
ncbi:hypothetical protein MSG28_004852 [Choristoneura fumiferana]|uniref:Uncharacterized protein n=1 Tax=Choristoneura fumiferana TaxID=7141 RepID=A0ACC0K7U3_CHOFU|nr:hypothetical protein MSG28_004852 [Choristoneura fumiferana]